MRILYGLTFFFLLAAHSFAEADVTLPVESDKTQERPEALEEWHFYLTSYYTPRTVTGDITRRNTEGFISTDLVATGESLDLDKSKGLMYALGTEYKKWTLGFTLMPSKFNDQGNGYAFFDVEDQKGNGVLTRVDTTAEVHINMYLTNILYEVVHTPHTSLKVGIGAGASVVKFNITPQNQSINEVAYDGSQPFGFVTINMVNNYGDFLYSFNVNGVSMDQGDVHVNYSDYTVELGYRFYHKKFNVDIIGGYRMVNFALDGSNETDNVNHKYDVDLTLKGPFIGITLSY